MGGGRRGKEMLEGREKMVEDGMREELVVD